MRCKSCDVILSDKEAIRKSPVTQEYLDMCNLCLASIMYDIPESIPADDELWDDGEYPEDIWDNETLNAE